MAGRNNKSLRSSLYTFALVNTLRINTPGVVESNKAVIVDTNKDLSGIRNLSVQNLNVGGSLLTASASELNYVDTTPGIGEEFKTLVLDGNLNISNINSLSANYLTGTIQTSNQPNITSLGTLSNLNIQGSLNIIGHNGSTTGLRLNNTLITATASELNKLDGLTSNTAELNVLTGITATVTQLNYTNTTKGTAEAEKALIFDINRDITNIRNLTATNLTGTILTASQPNITSVGTLNNLTINGNVNIANHNGLTSGLQLNGTLIMSSATEINYLKNINPGTVIGNKVLAVDNNKDLLGFRNISLSGNLSTAQITLNGLLIQSSADEINNLYNITKGTASNNKAVILDTNKDFSGIRNLTIDNLILNGSNLQLPSGNTATRPISPSLGFIRYNTETSQFEGYGAGNSWGSLGGVTNVQQTTKILAENSPGSNDNNLRFINNNSETMRITSTGNVGINNNNPSYKLDISGTLNCTSTSNFRDTMTIYKLGSNNNSIVSGLTLKNSYSLASSSGLGIGIDFWMPDSSGEQSYSGSLNCVVTNPVTSNFANKFEFKLYNAGIINTAGSIDSTGLLTITSLSTSTITASSNVNIVNHNGTNTGLQLNGTLVTASATELNYNDITTTGTAEASKALILNSSRNITNINNISINNLALNNTINYRTLIDCGFTASDRILGLFNNTTSFYGFGAADNLLKIQGGHSNGIAFYTSASNSSIGTEQMRISSSTTNILNTLALNGTSITASATELNYNDITTIGIAESSKALILDSNRDITNIRNLTANNLTGTLQTASQPNITSLGTLTNLSTGNITLNGILITSTATELNYNDITTIGSAEANKALILDINKDIISIRNITATGLTITNLTLGSTAITATATEINKLAGTTAVTADFNKLASITATAVDINKLATVTASAAELNYNDITTIGTAEANKALILDVNKDITSIRNITATGLTITNLTLGSTAITATGAEINKLAGTTAVTADFNKLASITASAAELNYNDITTIGTAEASKALILDINKDIISIRNITATGLTITNLTLGSTAITATATEINKLAGTTAVTADFNKLASITATASQLNYLSGTTLGTITASKALTVDSNSDINSILRLKKIASGQQIYFENGTSTGVLYHFNNGDLYFGSISNNGLIFQTNNNVRCSISSAGIFNIGAGWSISSTTVTATAAELNYNDITTIGIAEASKALILDINKDIISIRNITATGLTITNLTLGSTAITATGAEINKLAGTTAVTADFNKLASVTASAAELNYNDITTIGTAEASKALILDVNKDIISIRNITATGLTITNLTLGSTAITATGAEINKLAGTTVVTADFNKLASVTATASQLNYLSGTTLGTITASKALTVDSNSDINSILRLKKIASSQQIRFENGTSIGTIYQFLNGSLNIGTTSENDLIFQTNNFNRLTITSAGLMNIQVGWQISGTTVTATAAEINYLDLTTGPGTAEASKALVLNTNKDISGINSLSCTSLTVNGTNITSGGTPAELTGVTAGTAEASKALILNSSRNITNINNISVNNLALNNTINYRTLIDCGFTTSDRILGLFNNTTSFYGFGAADNLLKIQGGQSNGIAFYTNATNSSTGIMQIKLSSTSTSILQTTSSTNSTSGALIVSGGIGCAGSLNIAGAIITEDYISATKYLATSSYIRSGWNTTTNANFVGNWASPGYWGIGYDSTLGSDYNTIRLGTCDSTGTWSGYANVRCKSVYAQGTISIAIDGYAYYRSDDVSGRIGAQTNSYSIYASGRIACNGELNVISDYRTKNNIEILDNEYCQDFIKKTIPVKFNYNNDPDQKHFGYIAQDVYKAGFTDLVALCPQEGLEEIIEEDGFINPKDVSFAMSTNELIPILAKNIKIIYDEKEILEQKIENQQNIIENLQNENQQLKDQIQNQNNLINDILLRLQNLENNN